MERVVEIVPEAGLHARPAAKFVETATGYDAEITVAPIENGEVGEAVASRLETEGVEYAVPELGVMIETPGAVFMSTELASRVDFLSIGTDDLAQYVMAAARDDELVADLHDPLHPPVLRAISRTVEAAHANDAWVGMCGEMAGDPDLTELLVGLGLDELSRDEINEADAVIIAADTSVNRDRFEGKPLEKGTVKDAINDAESLVNRAVEKAGGAADATTTEPTGETTSAESEGDDRRDGDPEKGIFRRLKRLFP
jgi:fructose-specific component phosphotransferase system IIB-like protein